MKSQKSRQHAAAEAAASRQAAGATHPADGQSAQEAEAHDAHAMNQAARSVMHPDRYDLEWRFYHGAVHA
jgi:hypothetical protein